MLISLKKILDGQFTLAFLATGWFLHMINIQLN